MSSFFPSRILDPDLFDCDDDDESVNNDASIPAIPCRPPNITSSQSSQCPDVALEETHNESAHVLDDPVEVTVCYVGSSDTEDFPIASNTHKITNSEEISGFSSYLLFVWAFWKPHDVSHFDVDAFICFDSYTNSRSTTGNQNNIIEMVDLTNDDNDQQTQSDEFTEKDESIALSLSNSKTQVQCDRRSSTPRTTLESLQSQHKRQDLETKKPEITKTVHPFFVNTSRKLKSSDSLSSASSVTTSNPPGFSNEKATGEDKHSIPSRTRKSSNSKNTSSSVLSTTSSDSFKPRRSNPSKSKSLPSSILPSSASSSSHSSNSSSSKADFSIPQIYATENQRAEKQLTQLNRLRLERSHSDKLLSSLQKSSSTSHPFFKMCSRTNKPPLNTSSSTNAVECLSVNHQGVDTTAEPVGDGYAMASKDVPNRWSFKVKRNGKCVPAPLPSRFCMHVTQSMAASSIGDENFIPADPKCDDIHSLLAPYLKKAKASCVQHIDLPPMQLNLSTKESKRDRSEAALNSETMIEFSDIPRFMSFTYPNIDFSRPIFQSLLQKLPAMNKNNSKANVKQKKAKETILGQDENVEYIVKWLKEWKMVTRSLGTSFESVEDVEKNKKRKEKPKKTKKKKRSSYDDSDLDDFIVSDCTEVSLQGEEDNSDTDTSVYSYNSPHTSDFSSPDGKTSSRKRKKPKSFRSDHRNRHGYVSKFIKSNILLLIGPSGVGKTSSVYECAKQVSFDVFEINAGIKRGGKEVALLLGEMCTSHLVGGSQHKTAVKSDSLPVKKKETEEKKRRKGITSFFTKPSGFQSQGATKCDDESEMANAATLDIDIDGNTDPETNDIISTRKCSPSLPHTHSFSDSSSSSIHPLQQTKDQCMERKKTTKQTVILIDEADILFEDDKGFWNSVIQIQEVSKRPIIITCNDSSTIPFDDLHLQETLYFQPPQSEELAAYLQLKSFQQSVFLDPRDILRVVQLYNRDVRKCENAMAVWGRLHQCSECSNAEAKQVNWVVFRSESLHNPEDVNIDDTTTGKEEGKKKRKLVILESESEKEEMGDLENQPVRDFSKRVKIESIPNSLHSTSSSSESLLMGSDSDMHPGSTSSSSYVQEPLMVQPSALKLVPSFTHKLLGLCHPKLKQNEINHLESINEAVQCALVAGEWDSEELMWNEISMLQTKTNEKLGETVDTTMDKLQDIVNALDCHSFMDAFVAPSEARRMQIFEIDQYTPQADDVITSPSTISWFKPPKWSDHLTTDLEIEATLKCMNLQLLSTKTGFGKSVEPGQDNGQEVASNVLRGVKALGVDQYQSLHYHYTHILSNLYLDFSNNQSVFTDYRPFVTLIAELDDANRKSQNENEEGKGRGRRRTRRYAVPKYFDLPDTDLLGVMVKWSDVNEMYKPCLNEDNLKLKSLIDDVKQRCQSILGC